MQAAAIIVAIIAGVIIIYYLFEEILGRVRGPSNAQGVSVVTIAATPTTIIRGTKVGAVVTVTALGYTTSPVPLNYRIQLFDDELFDDVLVDFVTNSPTVPGIKPVLVPKLAKGVSLYSFNVTKSFTLTCNADGEIIGPDGSSGESDPEVYARFTILSGDPAPTLDSNRITIRCVAPAPGAPAGVIPGAGTGVGAGGDGGELVNTEDD